MPISEVGVPMSTDLFGPAQASRKVVEDEIPGIALRDMRWAEAIRDRAIHQ